MNNSGTSAVYYLLNKPKGVITTTNDELGRPMVLDLVKVEEKIFPVGRLDENTSGLIILTSDGEFSNILTHPSHNTSKTYRLKIKGFLPKPVIKKFEMGVELQDGKTRPAIIKLISREKGCEVFELTIFEGRNRQIRRMCGKLGLELLDLERVAIGPLRNNTLKAGKYRMLSEQEVALLKKVS